MNGYRIILIFVLFMCFCFDLGYPTVQRYDPSESTPYDARYYSQMVTSSLDSVAAPWRYRILTPALAKPLYYCIAKLNLGTWNPLFLSLLVVNSAFVSLSCVLLIKISLHLDLDAMTALLAAMLYAVSFSVVNLQLAGLVDAADAFFLIAIILALFKKRWWAVAALIVVGVTAKETVLLFGVVGSVAWWLVEKFPARRQRLIALGWIVGALIVGVATRRIIMSLLGGQIYAEHEFSWNKVVAMIQYIPNTLFCKSMVYNFLYLLPLGLWRLGALPRPFVVTTAVLTLTAFLAAIYVPIGENVGRAIFNVAAPLLVISSAMFIRDFIRPKAQVLPQASAAAKK